MSAIRRRMRESSLIRDYMVQKLLLEMKTLTRIRNSGQYKSTIFELPKKQKHILETLEITLLDYFDWN
ncbi:MAG: hypothetical protein ACOCJN_05230 [Spirochaetaceae bacterium JB067]